MDTPLLKELPARPTTFAETPVPPLPDVDKTKADEASVKYSFYRTTLSNHRTGLSVHRTALSEYRTDLSMYRTDLSTERTEMSMRRTGMSFQRTRMSADRTLMSVIRTSLSLIGFGFTIFQIFQKLYEAQVIKHDQAPRNFGAALVVLGIGMLISGIVYHVSFMRELRRERQQMKDDGLLHAESQFPVSLTLMVALVLLAFGFVAILSMVSG